MNRIVGIAAGAFGSALLATACGVTPFTGPLAEGKAWQKTCPDTALASSMHIDISGTFATKTFGGDLKKGLRDLAARTAVCGGQLRVTAFAYNSAQTFELFDGRLALPGTTENARWRRLPEAVDEVVAQTSRAYNVIVADGPYKGSDIVAQLRLADEFGQQVAPDATLDVLVMSDGFQSVAAKPTSVGTREEAARFADQLQVPQVRGQLMFAGLGDRVDGTRVKSADIELLKTFYERVCQRTKASPCSAVTDYEPRVGATS